MTPKNMKITSATGNIGIAVHASVVLVLNKKSLPEKITDVTTTHLVPETIDPLRRLDHTVAQAFQKEGYFAPISQLLSVLVPVDTEGKKRHSLAIRGEVTSDYMTARPVYWGKEVPFTFLKTLAAELASNENLDLVMVDITGKPPATVEWE